MTSLNTLRLLLAIAHGGSYRLASFDVSAAYLYGPIDGRKVYVQPPVLLRPESEGFGDEAEEGHVQHPASGEMLMEGLQGGCRASWTGSQ